MLSSPDDVPDTMTVEKFWEMFGRREHATLDFKRGVSAGATLDAIPAMAMTDGGLIVHGVADDRSIVGCPLSQRTQDRITRFAAECDVEVRVKAIQVGGTELTLTFVPQVLGRIVTTPNGRLLRRVGGDSRPLRGDSLRRFVLARSEHPGEEEIVSRFDPDDFDLSLVNRALGANGRRGGAIAGTCRSARRQQNRWRTERESPRRSADTLRFGSHPIRSGGESSVRPAHRGWPRPRTYQPSCGDQRTLAAPPGTMPGIDRQAH